MSKLQSFKRLIAEDFEEKERKLVEKIAFSFNIFAEDVLGALNKQITIDDNLDMSKKDISVTVDNSGNPIAVLKLRTGLSRNCQGITVIKVVNSITPGIPPTGTPFVSFSETATGIITISNITNLLANNQYQLRLILF